jgi:hypothetical protein
MPKKYCLKSCIGPDPYNLSDNPESPSNPWKDPTQGLAFAGEASNPKWNPQTKAQLEYIDRLQHDGLVAIYPSTRPRTSWAVRTIEAAKSQAAASKTETDNELEGLSEELASAIRQNQAQGKEREDLIRVPKLALEGGEDGKIEFRMALRVPPLIEFPPNGILKVRTPAGQVVDIALPESAFKDKDKHKDKNNNNSGPSRGDPTDTALSMKQQQSKRLKKLVLTGRGGPGGYAYAGSTLIRPYVCPTDSAGVPIHLKRNQRFGAVVCSGTTGRHAPQSSQSKFQELALRKQKLEDKIKGILEGVHVDSKVQQATFTSGVVPTRPKTSRTSRRTSRNRGRSVKDLNSESCASAEVTSVKTSADPVASAATTTAADFAGGTAAAGSPATGGGPTSKHVERDAAEASGDNDDDDDGYSDEDYEDEFE